MPEESLNDREKGVGRPSPDGRSAAMMSLSSAFTRCAVFASMLSVLLFFAPLPATAEISFREVSRQTGIFQITPTWGGNWVDVNSDGFDDIYIGNHHYTEKYSRIQIPPALFINNGNGTFTESADSYGITSFGDFHGSSSADYNNDGFQDIFQSQGGRKGQGADPNFLYKNMGDGTFVEVANAAGVDMPRGRGRSGFWLDFDLDGFLDLYICNVALDGYPSTLMRNNGDDTFTDVGFLTGTQVQGAVRGTPVDFDGDGLLDVSLAVNNESIILERNNGDGTFTEVTSLIGLGEITRGTGFDWGDYDNDGDMDLYVTRALTSDDVEWNETELYFLAYVRSGTEKGLDFTTSGTTVTFDLFKYQWRIEPQYIYIGAQGIHPAGMPFALFAGAPEVQGKPIYNVGDEDACYIWEETGEWHLRCATSLLITAQSPAGIVKSDGEITSVTPVDFEIFTGNLPNSLYQNVDGTFVETGLAAGVADTSKSTEPIWADFDNDGWLDLYVVNLDGVSNAPNKLYMNNGDGTFRETAALSGVEGYVPGNGDGAAVSDFDNDGFLDLLVLNGYGQAPFSFGPHLLYRNNGNSNHWLKVSLEGVVSNRDGIGATVTIRSGPNVYTRQQNGGFVRFSQNTKTMHFGLGAYTVVDELEVRWPSGIVQTIYSVGTDQTLILREPSVGIDIVPAGGPFSPGGELAYEVTLTNNLNVGISLDLWAYLTLPDGGRFPVSQDAGPLEVTLPPFSSVTRQVSHGIPFNALPGDYVYHGVVGRHPHVWAEDGFIFSIVP